MSIKVDPPPRSSNFVDWINWLYRSVYKRIAPGPFFLSSYDVATLPDAAESEGAVVYVSNETGGKVIAFSDGVNWRRVTDRAIVT